MQESLAPTERALGCGCRAVMPAGVAPGWHRLTSAECKAHRSIAIAQTAPRDAWIRKCGCVYVSSVLVHCAMCSSTRQFHLERVQRLRADIEQTLALVESNDRGPAPCAQDAAAQ